jgi:rod shape-determining protein MreD
MTESSGWFVIILTIIAAMILTLLPMPEWATWMRPAWVLMALIYWATVMPFRVNVGTAWFIGLCLDVLNGTLLGEHALALTLVVYFAVRIHSRFRMFPLIQQAMVVFLFVLMNQFILYCVQGFVGELPKSWLYWSSAFTSMLLWPWVFVILHDCRRRFRVV